MLVSPRKAKADPVPMMLRSLLLGKTLLMTRPHSFDIYIVLEEEIWTKVVPSLNKMSLSPLG
jgi:hypothetical protein